MANLLKAKTLTSSRNSTTKRKRAFSSSTDNYMSDASYFIGMRSQSVRKSSSTSHYTVNEGARVWKEEGGYPTHFRYNYDRFFDPEPEKALAQDLGFSLTSDQKVEKVFDTFILGKGERIGPRKRRKNWLSCLGWAYFEELVLRVKHLSFKHFQ